MTKKDYGLKLFGWIAVIGIPVVGLMLVSRRAEAGKTKVAPVQEDSVPQKIRDALNAILSSVDLPVLDDAGNPTGPLTHVGWWMYRGRWINVEEYPGSGTTEDIAPIAAPLSLYKYTGRFRWMVMHSAAEASPVLGQGDATTSGESVDADGARGKAGQAAADAAAAWVDSFMSGTG